MPLTRRFLIAPSLTRLIRKELGWEKVVEGHFAPQGERQSHVRIQKEAAHLVLTSLNANPESDEEMTELPMAPAEALLQVCPGVLSLERSHVPLPSGTALLDRLVSPGPLDLVSLEFASRVEAEGFVTPVWFGREVTENESYIYQAMALVGLPSTPEAEASNAALEAVLDIIEAAVSPVSSNMGKEHIQASYLEEELFSPTASAASAKLQARAEAPESAKRTGVDAKPRRPKLETVRDQSQGEDQRLASIFMELSTSLTEPPHQNERLPADIRPRLTARRSNH